MLRILICAILLTSTVYAEDWELTNIDWQDASDSVWLQHYSDATLEFTVRDTSNRQSWDTTIALVDGRINYAVYTIWFTGQTHPSTWVHQKDMKIGLTGSFTWYLHGARFPSDVDSSFLYNYLDGVAQDTATATTDETAWLDYALTAYTGKYNSADIKIYYTGAAYPVTWKWALDKADTTGGLPEPGQSNHCIVWGDVGGLGMSLNQAKNARVYFTLAGKVNDTCADRVYVRFTTDTLVNTNGRFQKELPWSSCLGGAEYNVKILLRDGSSREHSFTVPDSSTYKLIW